MEITVVHDTERNGIPSAITDETRPKTKERFNDQ